MGAAFMTDIRFEPCYHEAHALVQFEIELFVSGSVILFEYEGEGMPVSVKKRKGHIIGVVASVNKITELFIVSEMIDHNDLGFHFVYFLAGSGIKSQVLIVYGSATLP